MSKKKKIKQQQKFSRIFYTKISSIIILFLSNNLFYNFSKYNQSIRKYIFNYKIIKKYKKLYKICFFLKKKLKKKTIKSIFDFKLKYKNFLLIKTKKLKELIKFKNLKIYLYTLKKTFPIYYCYINYIKNYNLNKKKNKYKPFYNFKNFFFIIKLKKKLNKKNKKKQYFFKKNIFKFLKKNAKKNYII